MERVGSNIAREGGEADNQRLMYATNGHFMVGALEEIFYLLVVGGWRPDIVVSNTDKKIWPHRINLDEDRVNIEENQD